MSWRAASLLIAGLGLFLSCTSVESEAEDVTPRLAPRGVVVILADDVGVEAFGCYGGESYSTPNIDALAARGMRFTSFHAQPLCTPSRVKLLTGRSNLRNYLRFSVLDPHETTLAHVLGGAGYATAAVGKWQLHGAEHYGEWAGIGARPEEAGFQRWCLWQVEALGSRYWGPLLEVDGELVQGAEEDYGPREFLEYALRFLEQHREDPFLLFLPLALVHDPYTRTPDSPAREERDVQADFADMVAELDRTVGGVVEGLERLGLRDSTLVLFTSDNGTGRRISSRANAREVRGGKGLTLDRGTHVPLVASWPGVVAEGTSCDDLMDLSDVLPTLAELCEAPLDEQLVLDGHSFAARLRGEGHTPREWISIYCNPRPGNAKFPPRLFVRDSRFKLYGDGRFYDVAEDPEEEHPLSRVNLTGTGARALEDLSRALDSLPPPSQDLGGDALRERRSAAIAK